MFSSLTGGGAAAAETPFAFCPPPLRPSFPRPFGDRHLDYSHSRCAVAAPPLSDRASGDSDHLAIVVVGACDTDNNNLGSGEQQFANMGRMPHG